MGSADDRTFKANFTVEGLAKLTARVTDKLKEFMGDYTDDTLVEYVIVLLKNGRHREEAKNELDVFLGDDSDSFVSWLWEHLSSSLHLYVHNQATAVDEVPKVRPVVTEQIGKDGSHQRDPKSGKGLISDNVSIARHKRDFKVVVRDTNELPTFRSSIVGKITSEKRGHQRTTHARSPSPQPLQNRKRSRHDEPQEMKRDAASHPIISAPRRLLQFAVREAVGTPRQSVTENESSSMKRLRSVVATPNEALPIVDHPKAIKPVAGVPNAMATVVKAVQEAVEDVRKVRPGRSVFDRLGRDMDVSVTEEQVTQFSVDDVEGEDFEDYNLIQDHVHMRPNYVGAGDHVLSEESLRMVTRNTGFPSASTSNGEGNRIGNRLAHRDSRAGISQVEIHPGNGVRNAVKPQLSGFMHVEDIMQLQLSGTREEVVPASAPNNSRKAVNNSLHSNTWKSPNYQEATDVPEMISKRTVLDIEVKSGGQMIVETNLPDMTQNSIVKPAIDGQKESQKTLPSLPGAFAGGRPLEDADSRTIFVSNVNFSATKDSLSRHFNKFGEVLKVIIVTDSGTGQPVGSAYIEFMRKEAADNALSLDGSTFLLRKLKVVKRSSAHQEATPSTTWPRAARGPLYAASRFPRVAFPRGISGRYRSRFPVKPGARSMQWKRGDTRATTTDAGPLPSGQGTLPQTPRSLTYVRTEPKPDGKPGTT